MALTLASSIIPASTLTTASPPPPLQLLSSRPGVPLPAEVRRSIYRLLFAGSVIHLSHIDYWARVEKDPNEWKTVKAQHDEDSGYGIFFASKDSQADAAPVFYALAIWDFEHCAEIENCRSNVYDLTRLERLACPPDLSPGDFVGERHCFPSVKHLLLSIDRGAPISLDLPPHWLHDQTAVQKAKEYLSEKWDKKAFWSGLESTKKFTELCPKESYTISCIVWFRYSPYVLNGEKADVDNNSVLTWSSKWIFDCDKETLNRHEDAVTIEEDPNYALHLRALDADGENELDAEDDENAFANQDEDDNRDENSEEDDDREPGSDEAEETDDDGAGVLHLLDQIDWDEPLEPSDEDDSDYEIEDEEE